MAPVDLNIVCFRFNPGDRDEAALNALNQEILLRLHESGVAAPSYTTLRGRYALRAAITNHRSRREDFDILVREVMRIAAELTWSAERRTVGFHGPAPARPSRHCVQLGCRVPLVPSDAIECRFQSRILAESIR